LTEPVGSTGSLALDFSNFEGGATALDVTKGGDQVVNPGLTLNLPLTSSSQQRVTSVIGSPANDAIISNTPTTTFGTAGTPSAPGAPAHPPSSVPTQWVYLDFSGAGFKPIAGETLHTYSTDDQQEILSQLQTVFQPFSNLIKFTLTQTEAQSGAGVNG